MSEPYPHEKRVQRLAYGALAISAGLAAAQAIRGDGVLFGFEVPLLAILGLLVAGAVVAAVAVAKRNPALALAGAALLVLSVLPGGLARPGPLGYGLGLAFGVALLAMGELVDMTRRYEHAHRAVEKENVPEEHVNRVTDEAVKTLATRAGLALAAATAGVGLAFLLAAAGPRQWRAAVETTAPLGVAVATLAILGAASLYILVRGSEFKLPRREPRPKETVPDVAE